MNLGNTFVQVHLWIVVSLPTPGDGSVVLVNFTTRRRDSDTNCLVQAGEHPWVKHETVVEYEKARVFDVKTQANVTKQATLCPPHKDVSPDLLARIQSGALKSDLTPQKVQKIIEWSMGEQARLAEQAKLKK